MRLGPAAVLMMTACGRLGFMDAPADAPSSPVSDDARVAMRCDVDLGDAGVCTGASCLQTMASGLSQPYYIAADCTNVYWTDIVAGTVMSCPVGGCGPAPALLASGQNAPAGIANDVTNIYWANSGDGTIDACAIADCAGTTHLVADDQTGVGELATDGANVYWTRGDGIVMECATGGCNDHPIVLAANQPVPNSIVVSRGTVYWTTYYGASVLACSADGCDGAPAIIMNGTGDTSTLAAGPGGSIYWRDIGGDVNGCALGDCTAGFEMLAGPMPPDGGNDPGGIATDADFVYWSTYTATGSIFACEPNNCAATTTMLATDLFWPQRIAIAAGYVFWTDSYGGAVQRLQK